MLSKYCSQETLSDHYSLITKAIQSCQGLPLAIAVIAGLQLQTTEDWQDIITYLERANVNTTTSHINYDYSIYGTIDFSIQKLKPEHQRLFRYLGVFKRVPIPSTCIMMLWRLDEIETKSILDDMNDRSLLKYVESDGYRNQTVLYQPYIQVT